MLGDVLEVLGRDDGVALPTVEATVVEDFDRAADRATATQDPWREPFKVPLEIRLLSVPSRIRALKYRRSSDGPRPPDASSLHVWFDPPRRARVDQTWEHEGTVGHLACIAEDFLESGPVRERTYDVVGARWLKRPRGGPNGDELSTHFWPPRLRAIVTGLAFGEPRADVVAGREVARVPARRRPDGMLWPHWLGTGSEFDLAFDLEHGHLLSYSAIRGGRRIEGRTITSITYGVPIPPSTFDVTVTRAG